MPVFLIVIGLMLLVSGTRSSTDELYTLLESDIKAFLAWIFLIVVIGMAGISKTIRPVSNAFLLLIIVAFFLKNGQNVVTGIKQTLSD